MKNLILSLIFIAVAAVNTSCKLNVLRGSGNKTSSSPAVTSFNAVKVDVTVKVTINMQDGVQPGMQINGYENVVKHIKTSVADNTLRIYSDLDETWTIDNNDVSVTLTMPSITALDLTGASDADMHGNITGTSFKVAISGASDIKIDNLNVDDFSLEISGAGDVRINGGTVKHATYEINGAGDLKAFPLQAGEAVATISGAGTGEVTALQKLTAEINGAGTIRYKGHPAITQDVSGVGTIKDAN